MRHVIIGAAGLVLCAMVAGMSPARAAEEAPALELAPCTIELVDGRTVEGRLAVQFDLDDHLVVYSPRLATVRSLLKQHVHAVTVDGKREQLNPKRALTEEDKRLLGPVTWPDEPPEKGHKPAYTTEEWEKPGRLLVWARPGKTGRLREAAGWLANGKPMADLPKTVIWGGPTWNRSRRLAEFDEHTDILLPAADKPYSVRGGAHWHQSKGFLARHLTVEEGGSFKANVKGLFGNLWISAGSDFYGGGCAYFRGTQHTFIRNGDPRPVGEPIDWASLEAKALARKWVLRKEDPGASMEIIGGAGSGDETHVQGGRLIVGEGSTVLIGPRCCQTVGPAAVLQLQSGAVFAKNVNQPHKQDMLVRGRLQAGSPERPITEDCYVGLSFKDHERLFAGVHQQKRGEYRGLEIWPGAQVRVHSADPAEARLVFRYHGKDGFGDTGAPPKKGEPGYEAYLAIPRQIDITIWDGADVQLDGVLFDDVRKGGLRLMDPDIRDAWKHVFYGKQNAGPPDALVARYDPSDERRKDVAESSGPDGSVDRFFGVPLFVRDDKPTWEARIQPVGGQFPAGEDVTVTMRVATNQENLDGVEVRYTVDGSEPTAEATRYTGPFTLRDGATVKARCFCDGEALRGELAEATFEFIPPRKPDGPAATAPGLRYEYYRGSWRHRPDFEKDTPRPGGVARTVGPDARPDGRDTVVLFTGYLQAPRAGVYRFHPSPTNSGRISVGDRVVWDPNPLNPKRHRHELVVLGAGKHRFRAAFFFGEGVDDGELGLAWQGPGIERGPVPPSAFSHKP
ncbi:MAG: chitobiase/beta-hexosaminidase C-terminal domain-containing protein [Phycisphaerae bacterium]